MKIQSIEIAQVGSQYFKLQSGNLYLSTHDSRAQWIADLLLRMSIKTVARLNMLASYSPKFLPTG